MHANSIASLDTTRADRAAAESGAGTLQDALRIAIRNLEATKVTNLATDRKSLREEAEGWSCPQVDHYDVVVGLEPT